MTNQNNIDGYGFSARLLAAAAASAPLLRTGNGPTSFLPQNQQQQQLLQLNSGGIGVGVGGGVNGSAKSMMLGVKRGREKLNNNNCKNHLISSDPQHYYYLQKDEISSCKRQRMVSSLSNKHVAPNNILQHSDCDETTIINPNPITNDDNNNPYLFHDERNSIRDHTSINVDRNDGNVVEGVQQQAIVAEGLEPNEVSQLQAKYDGNQQIVQYNSGLNLQNNPLNQVNFQNHSQPCSQAEGSFNVVPSNTADKRRVVLGRAKESVSRLCDPERFHETDPDLLLRLLVEDEGSVQKLFSESCKKKKVSLPIRFNSSQMTSFFHPSTAEQRQAFQDKEMVAAIQEGNVEQVRLLWRSGKRVDGCNNFGESFLHIACRRGYDSLVEFLVKEAMTNLRICDDHGRNPLHSTCWSIKPKYRIAKLIVEREPLLFMFADARGHTPLMYVQSSAWGDWCTFISLCHELRLLYR